MIHPYGKDEKVLFCCSAFLLLQFILESQYCAPSHSECQCAHCTEIEFLIFLVSPHLLPHLILPLFTHLSPGPPTLRRCLRHLLRVRSTHSWIPCARPTHLITIERSKPLPCLSVPPPHHPLLSPPSCPHCYAPSHSDSDCQCAPFTVH